MSVAGLFLGAAVLGGGLAHLLRLPPLVGFLAAGVTLNAFGVAEPVWLQPAADLGVTVLLFAIGLKLELPMLTRPRVWGTTLAHGAGMVLVVTPLLLGLAALGLPPVAGTGAAGLALVAFAMSFSSTVLAFKILEDRGESASLHGQVVIGILIVQDLVAVGFIMASRGELPSPWALTLLTLPVVVRALRRGWSQLGRGELLPLFGLAVALIPGYLWFEAVGLKGDLGALVLGISLSGARRAPDLAKALLSIKDLLLVAFFLSIGLTGLPSWPAVAFGLLALGLIPVKAFGFQLLLRRSRLRTRTATLSALSLTSYSEFGLIVAAVAVGAGLLSADWLVVMAVTVALSFTLASVVNRLTPRVIRHAERTWPDPAPARLASDDRPIDVGEAHVLVLGMGRVGSTAYRRLAGQGLRCVGIEQDQVVVTELRSQGVDVRLGDAVDAAFWSRITDAHHIRTAVLAMPEHEANLRATELLREAGFAGEVVAVAQREEDVAWLRHLGVAAINLYDGAGDALADLVSPAPDEGARPD